MIDPVRPGLEIRGRFGQEVLAARSGQVAYSGNGVVGYGKVLIIKHNDSYLSVYGHNDFVFVDEGNFVAAGQVIARFGKNEKSEDGGLLRFEIWLNGRSLDPLCLLPRW